MNMSIIANFKKDAFKYSALNLIIKGTNFFLIPLYLTKLSVGEYGLLALLLVVQSVIYSLGSCGLHSTLQRYISPIDNKAELTLYFSHTFIFISLNVLFLALSTFLFNILISDIAFSSKCYLNLIVVVAILEIYEALPQAVMIAKRQIYNFSLAGLVGIPLKIVPIYIFVQVMDDKIYGVLSGMVIGLLFSLIFNMRLCSLKVKFKRIKIKEKFVEFYSYGMPLAIRDLMIVTYTFADRFFIEHYLGLEKVGIYNFYAQIASLASIFFVFPVKTAISAHAFRLDKPKLIMFCSESFRHFVIYSIFILAVILILIVGIQFHSISKNLYFSNTELLPLIVGGQILYGIRAIVGIPLHIEKDSKSILLIFIAGAAYNIIANIFLVKLYGLLGASIAIFTTQLLILFFTFYISNKYLKVSYNWKLFFIFFCTILFPCIHFF